MARRPESWPFGTSFSAVLKKMSEPSLLTPVRLLSWLLVPEEISDTSPSFQR